MESLSCDDAQRITSTENHVMEKSQRGQKIFSIATLLLLTGRSEILAMPLVKRIERDCG